MSDVTQNETEASKMFAEKDNYESNMEVIVEFRGARYRVDFSRYSEEYRLMPRSLKKQIVLDDLKKAYGEEIAESKKTNVQKQTDGKRQSAVERLREKLMRKNPFRTDVKGNK